jgi:hypothetical protein
VLVGFLCAAAPLRASFFLRVVLGFTGRIRSACTCFAGSLCASDSHPFCVQAFLQLNDTKSGVRLMQDRRRARSDPVAVNVWVSLWGVVCALCSRVRASCGAQQASRRRMGLRIRGGCCVA